MGRPAFWDRQTADRQTQRVKNRGRHRPCGVLRKGLRWNQGTSLPSLAVAARGLDRSADSIPLENFFRARW